MYQNLQHILTGTSYIQSEILLTFALVILIFWVSFVKKPISEKQSNQFHLFGLISFLLLITFQWLVPTRIEPSPIFNGLIVFDGSAKYAKMLIFIAGAITCLHLMAFRYKFDGEMIILLLASTLGMCIIVMSTHFLSLIVAMELVSICSYVMVSFEKKRQNLEAGIKYLLFGATTSAIMFYGISLLYGATGTLQFTIPEFSAGLAQNQPMLIGIALLMTLAGLLFKLNAAPFHVWSPDVYQAGPTPIVSFLSVAPKLAALLVLIRMREYIKVDIILIFGILILASILIGNFAALWQNNLKRLLGYSGIAHAGFILIGILVGTESGIHASMFYLSVYVFINMGAFVLADILKSASGSYELDSFSGLSKQFKSAGIIALIIMVALVGLPPTSGFTGKFLVFISAWDVYEQGGNSIFLWIVGFGLINTAISIYYYFKLPYFLFVKNKPEGNDYTIHTSWLQTALLLVLGLSVIYLFFQPQFIQSWINRLF